MFNDAALPTPDWTLAYLLLGVGAVFFSWVLIIRRQLLIAWWNLDVQKSALNAQLASRAWLATAQLSPVGTETPYERALLAELGRRLDAATAAANEPHDVRAVIEFRLGLTLEVVLKSLQRYADPANHPQFARIPAAVAETTRAIDAAANVYNELVEGFNLRLTRFPANLAGDSLNMRLAQTFNVEQISVREAVLADHGHAITRLVDGRAHGLVGRPTTAAQAV